MQELISKYKHKVFSIKNNRGSIFVLALVFAAIFSIITVSVIALIARGNEMHARDVEVIRSYWANEGAMRVAMRYLTRTDIFLDHDIADFNATAGVTLNGYTPNVNIDMTITSYGLSTYDLHVNSNINSNISNITKVEGISLSTFHRYTYAQDSMNMLMSDMIINGNLYSTSIFKLVQDLSNEVHVTGMVECASEFDGTPYGYPWIPELEVQYGQGLGVYSGGNLTTQSSVEWFNKRLPNYKIVEPLDMDPLKPDLGRFDDGYDLDLLDPTGIYTDFMVLLEGVGDGKIYGYKYDADSSDSVWELIETKAVAAFDNGKIVSHKPIHVAGTLNGKLSIATYGNIYIAGNIFYDNIDITPGASDDILALVAGDTLMIRHDYSSYNTIGMDSAIANNWAVNDSLTIYASLFAVNGSVMAEPRLQFDWDPNWQRVHVMVFGSAMMSLTVPTFYHQNQGYEGHYTGDIRFLENLINAPGIPFPRYKDTEMIDYHNGEDGTQRFLITHKFWNNIVQ